MSITADLPSRVRGVRSKPLDNPPRPKLSYEYDEDNARFLDALLRRLPRRFDPSTEDDFPLLSSLARHDERHDRDAAAQLLFLAAVIHREADERRTAEYLLRHRLELISGHRSAGALLSQARCAAEMDVRRIRAREMPVDSIETALWSDDRPINAADEPSVGEMVVEFLEAVTGWPLATSDLRHTVQSAVTVFMEVSERHRRNRGRTPAVLAMRPKARPESRLVTHLGAEFGNPTVARSLSRLLIGGDGSPIETSLLWWSTRGIPDPELIPARVRRRWVRDLAQAEEACQRASAMRRSPEKFVMQLTPRSPKFVS